MDETERRSEDLRYQRIKAYARANPNWSGHRAETLREARTWETVKSKYLAVGLCHRCACQAAYGHQLGFSLVRSPSESCAPLVSALPVAAGKGSPWRRFRRGTKGA
jgi:hypothetical protein